MFSCRCYFAYFCVFIFEEKQLQTVQMQNEPATEQAAMMSIPYTPSPKPLSLTTDPEVQRTRKILMILIGASFVSFYFV